MIEASPPALRNSAAPGAYFGLLARPAGWWVSRPGVSWEVVRSALSV